MQAHHETLAQVLRPRPSIGYRNVKPLKPTTDYQASVLKKEAAKVRDIYRSGIERVFYDRDRPEHFWDRRVDTWMTHAELDLCIHDDTELAITKAIFDEANLTSTDIEPTKLRTQVEMQIAAVDAAKRIKNLLATQAALAF
jgi:hypothetical protein